MTDEELKKEANEYAKEIKNKYVYMDHVRASALGYLAGAEPREKRIAELENANTKISAECHKLVDSLEQKQNKIEELEEQIEQLKGCYNCRHFAEPYQLCCYSLGDEDYDCRGRKWEIKENV